MTYILKEGWMVCFVGLIANLIPCVARAMHRQQLQNVAVAVAEHDFEGRECDEAIHVESFAQVPPFLGGGWPGPPLMPVQTPLELCYKADPDTSPRRKNHSH